MMTLNNEQKKFLKKININPDRIKSDEDFIELEDKLAYYLQKHGFDDNYELTEEGKVCEAILDIIDDDNS